jgi:1-acyl-sn-glycerol-3-phosphate acyltransferase
LIVPSVVGRFLFTSGYTGVESLIALARTLAGDDQAVSRGTDRWARNVARGIGMEVDVFGAERLGLEASYVFMSNHQSHTDIIALFVALPIQPGFLAKKELRDVPLFGRAMEAGGHVFIDRTKHQEARETIADAARRVREGAPIAIFPEGTRSDTPTVKGFKKGGFHLAKQAGVPIVPIGIRGTAKILAKHGRAIHPGRVEVHIGEPVPPETIASLSVFDLVAHVRVRISELAEMPLLETSSQSSGGSRPA